MRADAPLLDRIADSEHPVLRMPVGRSWIAAPTAAVLYQFRELCIAGRPTQGVIVLNTADDEKVVSVERLSEEEGE